MSETGPIRASSLYHRVARLEEQVAELRDIVSYLALYVVAEGGPVKAEIVFNQKGRTQNMSDTGTPFGASDAQDFTATISLSDAAGFPTNATPDSAPTWLESSNGTVVTATPSADGLSCTFHPVALGSTNVTVNVVVGGQTLTGTGTATVEAGQPVKVALSFEEAPAANPNPPAPAPQAQYATDPTTGKVAYEHTGTGAIDAAVWPTASIQTTDTPPVALYTFANDTPGQPPTGASADWTPYTGATQPVS